MKRTWSVIALHHEQPSPSTWKAVITMARAWNRRGRDACTLSSVAGTTCSAMWGPLDEPAFAQLVAASDAVRRKGARLRVSARTVFDEGDYASADFADLFGVQLTDLNRPLLLNEREVALARGSCPRCVGGTGFVRTEGAMPVLDDAILAHPRGFSNGRRVARPETGWDVIQCDAAGLVISKRFAQMLAEHRVRGVECQPVVAASTKRVSEDWFRLLAARSVMNLCSEHTSVDDTPAFLPHSGEPLIAPSPATGPLSCPECGMGLRQVSGVRTVDAAEVGDAEVIAWHPDRAHSLYLHRRIHELAASKGMLVGTERLGLLRLCRHA